MASRDASESSPIRRPAALGLGCVTFGREIGREESFAMMDHAWMHGVRMFDSAVAYGDGASEQIVGEWLASRRPGDPALTVVTKVLPPYSAATIEEAVAGSLRRLGRIDLLYLHKWDATADDDGAMLALDRLVTAGKVRALGVSNYNAARLAAALARQERLGVARFRYLQNNHNLAVRSIDAALKELCAAHGIHAVGYSPLAAGFLTGKHSRGIAPGSRFDMVPGHQRIYFTAEAQAGLERLQAVAARSGRSLVELALAWAFFQPGVDTVLVGGRTPAHLDQALAAIAAHDPALLAQLDAD